MNAFTPASDQIIHYSYVDLSSRQIGRPIHLVQYDNGVAILAIAMYEDGSSYIIPSNANVNIRLGKSDGNFVYNPALGCDSTRQIVYFEITKQMAVLSGDTDPVIEVEINGRVACSSSIRIIIDKNPIQQTAIESTTEFKTGQEFAKEAINSAAAALASQKAAKTSETNALNSKNAAANSEQQAKAAYQEILASDIGMLETSLTKYNAVYQALYDSTGDSILDSKGNIMESRFIFVNMRDYQSALQRISILEYENRSFAKKDVTESKITKLQEQNEQLVDSIIRTHNIQQALLDSSNTELRDNMGRTLDGIVILATKQEITDLQNRIISLESLIKTLILESPVNRISVLELTANNFESHALFDNLYLRREIT